jgi:hypothetical protein
VSQNTEGAATRSTEYARPDSAADAIADLLSADPKRSWSMAAEVAVQLIEGWGVPS